MFSIQNDDILCHLFKNYLNLKEQLNLTRVCQHFRNIIVHYIWKNQYKEVKVIITPPYYILTNIISVNDPDQPWNPMELIQDCRSLCSEIELEEFLYRNHENIQRFFICLEQQFEEKYYEFPIKYCKLINLLEVQICRLQLYEDHLNELTVNCPKLEKLSIAKCYNRHNLPLEVGKDIAIEAIEKFENLKCLEINDPEASCMACEDIFAKLQIQQIILNVPTLFDSPEEKMHENASSSSSSSSYPCEELTLSGLSPISIDKFNSSLLNNLENLTKLTITDLCANNKFFKTLKESCYKLTDLKLHRFEIVNFLPLPTLNELVLEDGCGLTWQDLKQIFFEMTLKAFSSAFVMYSGTFHCFTIAPYLEYLVYTGSGDEFMQLFEMNKGNFENLTTLMWHQNYLDTSVTNVAKYCHNLQSLDINYNDFLICDLSNWKQLQKLHINSLAEIILSTEMLLKLLQHSSLTHLAILCASLNFSKNDQLILTDKDYATNLLYLDIPLRVFKIHQDFWLDLVGKNSKLNLLISSDYKAALVDYTFLSELIKHPKFPQRLKSIKMYGFNIDCKDLRENFDDTFNWMKLITDDLFCFEIYLIL